MEKTYPRFDLPDDIKSGPAKYIQMSDITRSVLVKNADSLESGLLRPRHGKVARLGAGAVEGVAQAVKIPSALMMFGGKGLIAVGGMFGEDSAVSEWGREMIKTGARQIDVLNKSITEKSDALFGLETDERSTMAYAVGNGFGNMATMLLAAYATGGAGAVATGVAQEIAGETEKRMDTARSRGQAPEDLSAKQAAAEFSATASYGAAAGVLEKVNLSKIMPFLRTSKKPIVAALQSAFSEASTETLQAVAAMGFGWADGTVDVSKIPQEIYDALVQGVVGGIVGGTTAGAFSLKNRHDVKNMYRDRLRGTVPEKDLETVVNALYDASVDTMTGVVVKELSLSEELRNKHGEIYSAMMDATAKAMDASESFKHLSPDERQDYVQQTSSMFADQVLAEANRRGVAIDDVLTGAQIVFENGGIAFKNRGFTLTEDGMFEQAMYASPLPTFGEFYDDVSNGKDRKKRYFKYNDYIAFPSDVILHDIKKHSLSKIDALDALGNLEKFEKIVISNKENSFGKKSILLKVKTENGSYGVVITLGKEHNFISTLFKDNEKSIDNWLKKREAEVPTNNPSAALGETPISVATSSHSLKNIISEIRKEINTSLEQRKTVRRGSYSQAENIIRLTKDADFSTLPHELAHFWLTEQETWANTKSASDEYVDTFNLALNWLGVKDGKTINRRAQEQFARGYEQYLLDGNLPRTQDSDITPTYQRYDKWLKRVYNEMNQPSKEPLSEDIIRFFQSMTTGSLPPAVLPVAGSRFEPEKENVPAVQKKQSPSADKTPAVRSDELSGAYWRAPAAAESADGKVSQAQERQNRLNRLNGLLNEDAVSTRYEEAHLADASQKAINLIETQGIDTARKMINGDIATDDGVLRTALMIEYEQKMLAAGNVKEYTRVLRLHTLEQTRRGQEISAERLNQDITNPAYWLKRVLLMRKNNLSKDVLANMPAAASIDGRVDKFVSQTASDAAREISTAKTEAQANEAVRRVVQKVQSITGKQMELFQSDRSAVGKAYDAVYDEVARDFRTGVISDTSKSVIRSAIRNGIGWLLAFGVAELLKPDDYISPFDLASQKEKDLVRFKNGVYNSVRIGGKYISLDYFGPLAAPIAGILEAKKREGTYEKAAAFAKSVLSQAGNIPGIKEASEIAGWLDKAQKQDTLKTADDFANGIFDQLLSRSIPAIATDIAKIIDPKERVNERGIVGAAAAKIPLARENLSAKVDLSEGTERKAESPLMTLLFGARVKTADQNAVAREIERLAAAGENVRLSDFTRAKEFRDLTAKGKAQARLDFARGFTVGGLRVKGFAEQVEKLTASAVYSRKTDSQKAEVINDITANILKKLKRKYRVKE